MQALKKLYPLVLLLSVACALKPATIPIVSIGNTGCDRKNLAVFDYRPEGRSWTAVCNDQVFACSDVGRRTTRCTPAQTDATHPELIRRAKLLQTLSPERSEFFVLEDVMSYETADFDRLVAIAGLASREVLEQAERVSRLVVLPPAKLAQVRTCTDRKLERIAVSDALELKLAPGATGLSCLEEPLKGVAVDPKWHGQRLFLVTQFSETDVQARIAANASAHSPAPALVAAASPSNPPAIGSSDVDAEIRALLDARAEDLLACVNAPRALIEATADGEGLVSVALRNTPAEDPAQGCVRAVVGTLNVASGPATVVHLVRATGR